MSWVVDGLKSVLREIAGFWSFHYHWYRLTELTVLLAGWGCSLPRREAPAVLPSALRRDFAVKAAIKKKLSSLSELSVTTLGTSANDEYECQQSGNNYVVMLATAE